VSRESAQRVVEAPGIRPGRAGPSPRPAGSACRRVLGVFGDQANGVTYVRFAQPFRYLAPSGFSLSTLGESLSLVRTPSGYAPDASILDGISLVLFPQFMASPALPDGSSLHLVEPLCEMARERGIPVAYSVDDHIAELGAHNPIYEMVTENGEQNLRGLLDRVDAYIVTTPVLADTLAARGRHVHLLPNCIEPARWKRRPRSSTSFRIGWAGSASHIDDLRMVLPAVRALQRRLDFEFLLLGPTTNPIEEEVRSIRRHRREFSPSRKARADAFLELAGQVREVRHRNLPFVRIDSYFDLLSALDLDVGLCPLLDTPFNRHKSALKFYEYAAVGTTTLASDVTPYREEVSMLVENDPAAWEAALERLLKDPAARDAELERQSEFVMAHRNIETMAARWAEALNALTQPQGGPDNAPS